ncbi:MFS transporter [Catenulispora pinisilvae]|uniref:MFS transporter n=1 Tax=Catenulispora pinisilvae TaxID=2705253 RepID=UPI002B272559|nr:MFS transporter [Catenulispora pinisilvae]
MTEPVPAPPSKLSTVRLLRGLGGGRYAFAAAVSALGAGLIRPFLLLYAVTISHLSPSRAGLALSAGFLAGLALVPLAGRWVDAGGRRTVVVTTIALRVLGLVLLLAIPGPAGFICACLLQGIGNQTGPVAQGAVVSSLAVGYERDAVLAALRSLGNAGLGAGALLATVALGSGAVGMRWLAVATAVGYLVSGVLIATVRLPDEQVPAGQRRIKQQRLKQRRVGQQRVGQRADRRRQPIGPADRPVLHRLTIMNLGNLPFALCFDILEVALPVVIVTQLAAAPAWSSGIFVANTVLVILIQLPVVVWMSRRPRRHVFGIAGAVLAASYLGFLVASAGHGAAGAMAIALVSVLYTLGEVLYTGVGTALVIDAAPPHLRGTALARWQLSLGLGRAIAPLAITLALSISPAALWLPLAVTTLIGAAVIVRHAPTDSGRQEQGASLAGNRGRYVRRYGRRYGQWAARRRARAVEEAELRRRLYAGGYRPECVKDRRPR